MTLRQNDGSMIRRRIARRWRYFTQLDLRPVDANCEATAKRSQRCNRIVARRHGELVPVDDEGQVVAAAHRSERILIKALAMSLSGIKRTWRLHCKCPLMTQSGHGMSVCTIIMQRDFWRTIEPNRDCS